MTLTFFLILLPLPPGCWDYKYVLPHPIYSVLVQGLMHARQAFYQVSQIPPSLPSVLLSFLSMSYHYAISMEEDNVLNCKVLVTTENNITILLSIGGGTLDALP